MLILFKWVTEHFRYFCSLKMKHLPSSVWRHSSKMQELKQLQIQIQFLSCTTGRNGLQKASFSTCCFHFSLLGPVAVFQKQKLWKRRCMTENMELVPYIYLKLQFERNTLFLFKLPYCCSEFISYMIPQDWISLSQLQAGNSLVLCANDWFSQSVATWLPGLFEVPAIAKLLTVAYFSLPSVSTPLLSSMNTMSVLVECVGTSPWILLHTKSLLSRLHVPQVFSAIETKKSHLETCQISADRA